jgi:Ca2+/Na+ antiporter
MTPMRCASRMRTRTIVVLVVLALLCGLVAAEFFVRSPSAVARFLLDNPFLVLAAVALAVVLAIPERAWERKRKKTFRT